MKYTKQELLGCVIKWSYEYLVIAHGDDLAIQMLSEHPNKGMIYTQYTLAYLNTCNFSIVSRPKHMHYEIY